MSKMKTSFVSVAMAFVLLLGGVFSFLGLNNLKAKAVDSGYLANPTMIYYFNDAYPSINHCAYMRLIGGEPFYEYAPVDSEEFNELITTEYFMNIMDGATVFIDIKTFLPDDDYLNTLFSELKEKDCRIVFISAYARTNFSADTLSYVDHFYQSDYSNIEKFAENKMKSFRERIDPTNAEEGYIHDALIVLDSNWVDMEAYGGMIQDLCDDSVYMDYLMDNMIINLPCSIPNASIEDMLLENNILLLVHTGDAVTGDNEFFNLVDGTTTYDNVTDLDHLFEQIAEQNSEQSFSVSYMCAVGFWEIDLCLYNFFKYEKEVKGRYIPLYTYERDIITYGSGGIDVITDQDLRVMYQEENEMANRENWIEEDWLAAMLSGALE